MDKTKTVFVSLFSGQCFSIFCHFNSDSIYLLSITKIENTENSVDTETIVFEGDETERGIKLSGYL